MKRRSILFNCQAVAFSMVLGALVGCFMGCARKVTRLNPSQQVDISGRWNDVDARLVSEAMIRDVLTHPWREEFKDAMDRRPVVIVGLVANKSHEHIESEVFIKSLEREFLNSGMVRVVQNSVFREKMREERADQQEFASLETQKKWGLELGADFMLFGTLTSVVDSYRRQKVAFYKVNLELANLETNEKVWIGDKEIKKYVKN